MSYQYTREVLGDGTVKLSITTEAGNRATLVVPANMVDDPAVYQMIDAAVQSVDHTDAVLRAVQTQERRH